MELEKYIYVLVPLISLIISQVIKFVIESIKNKKLMIKRLLNGSGGFPSTHTSLICSLLFTIMYKLGIGSVEFAIVFIIAIIVLYDAVGVRRDVERSNRIINELLLKNDKRKLKVDVGHSPLEILGGIILSIIVSTITVCLL